MLKQMRLSIQTWIWQMRNEIRLPVKKSISLATMCLFHLVNDQGMKNSNSSNCQKIKHSGNYWPLKIELFKGKLATYWKYFSSQAIELAKREWVASQGLIGKLCSATEKKNFFPSHSTIWNPFSHARLRIITRGKQKARRRRRRRKTQSTTFSTEISITHLSFLFHFTSPHRLLDAREKDSIFHPSSHFEHEWRNSST